MPAGVLARGRAHDALSVQVTKTNSTASSDSVSSIQSTDDEPSGVLNSDSKSALTTHLTPHVVPPQAASVTTQLSLLSHSVPRVPSMRSYRTRRFQAEPPRELLDAGVPPEVPQHFISRRTSSQPLLLNRLSERTRSETIPRARSSSQSRSAPSRSASMHDEEGYIDIYTRKCPSPASLTRSDSESSACSAEPHSPVISHFALEGYHEGETKLRVVNQDEVHEHVGQVRRIALHAAPRPRKYFVKSKAQIAEDEERLRRWYARYGHALPEQPEFA